MKGFLLLISAVLVLEKVLSFNSKISPSKSESFPTSLQKKSHVETNAAVTPFLPINITGNSYSGNKCPWTKKAEILSSSIRNANIVSRKPENILFHQVIKLTAGADKQDGALVTFFFSQSNNYSLSWKLPYTSKLDGVTYWTSSKYLCMDSNTKHQDRNDSILVLVSTTFGKNIHFSIVIQSEPINYFRAGDNGVLTVIPTHPQIVELKFDSKNLLMRITSDDAVCAVVSVQGTMCPINDVEDTIFSTGFWYTMTNKSGMTLMKKDFPNGGRVIFIALNDIQFCKRASIEQQWHNTLSLGHDSMSKTIRISFSEYISKSNLYIAIFTPLVILIVAVGVILTVWIKLFGKAYRSPPVSDDTPDTESESQVLVDQRSPSSSGSSSHCAGSSNQDGFNTAYMNIPYLTVQRSKSNSGTIPSAAATHENTESDEPAVGGESQNSESENIAQCDPNANSNENSTGLMTRRRNLVFIVAVCFFYYVVPVFQIVIKYQFKLYESGNMDLCYYNFWCANPLWIFSDFNHVYSNLAYVLLGSLFAFITFLRERDYKAQVESDKRYENEFGVAAHFGFYYSMGIGLILEGIMSGLYHVCPSQANFQFDTFFMYVNAATCLVRLYHGRQPQKFSILMYSVFLMIPVISSLMPIYDFLGKYFPFWAPVASLAVITCILIYHGLRKCLSSRFLIGNQPEFDEKTLDNYIKYFLIFFTSLGIANSFLLVIYLTNLILYFIVYVGKKAIYNEKILRLSLLSWSLLALVFWIISGVFYFQRKTTWEVSPADARTWNEECILFQFYDAHDLWHFFSAFAMFFSFMVLLTLDDDRIHVRRVKIF